MLSFADGVPVAIDGRALSPLELITELNARAGAQGVGRVDMVEDRLVGIKSREIYEAPGAIALIAAHSELESVCMELDLARFKRAAEQRWTELVYDGLWYSPLKSALDAFLNQAARHVTGDIRLRLHGGQAVVTGRRSPVSLYDFGLATYDTGDTFDQGLAKRLRGAVGPAQQDRRAPGAARVRLSRARAGRAPAGAAGVVPQAARAPGRCIDRDGHGRSHRVNRSLGARPWA